MVILSQKASTCLYCSWCRVASLLAWCRRADVPLLIMIILHYQHVSLYLIPGVTLKTLMPLMCSQACQCNLKLLNCRLDSLHDVLIPRCLQHLQLGSFG